MASDELVLYDIPSKTPCRTWSLNTWKTRFILNYKGIPYKTKWVEYPEIKANLEPHFQEHTISTYTVPTIILPYSHDHVTNSKEIAKVLESLYPSPPLILRDSEADSVLSRLTPLMIRIWDIIEPIILTHVPKRLLNEVNHEFWRKTREVWLNESVPDTEKDREAAKREGRWVTLEMAEEKLYADNGRDMQGRWKRAGLVIDEISALLGEDDDGPFFHGDEVGFVDFSWAGFLLFIMRIGNDLEEGMRCGCTRGENGWERHEKLLEAVAEWSVRDDH